VYAYRDGVPFTYSKCLVSLRKDYAQEEPQQKSQTSQSGFSYIFLATILQRIHHLAKMAEDFFDLPDAVD